MTTRPDLLDRSIPLTEAQEGYWHMQVSDPGNPAVQMLPLVTVMSEADVIVTDGFSGNIALKTIEGTARFITDLLKRAFTSSLRSKAGFVLSRPAFRLLSVHLDPNNHNGAVFLGLNGIVVKSHGGANVSGFANAIGVAAKLAANDITRRITEDLDHIRQQHAEATRAAGTAA